MKKRSISAITILILLSSVQGKSSWFSKAAGDISNAGKSLVKDVVQATNELVNNVTHSNPPPCGGSICDGLEHAKNEITGENQRKAEQADYENALAELQSTMAILQALTNDTEKIKAEQKRIQTEFDSYKQTNLTQANSFDSASETYVRILNEIQISLSESEHNLVNLKDSGTKITIASAKALAQLQQDLAESPIMNERTWQLHESIIGEFAKDNLQPGTPVYLSMQDFSKSVQAGKSYVQNTLNILGDLSNVKNSASDSSDKNFTLRLIEMSEAQIISCRTSVKTLAGSMAQAKTINQNLKTELAN